MATKAQFAANRANAQASTGPKTPEGKARSSRNAVSLGLFTKENCVHPEERDEYDKLYSALWLNLSPIGAMEELFATEVIRGAWRLRRCATAEASLATWVRTASRLEHEREHGKKVPCPRAQDPSYYEFSQSTQAAVDRARTQANGAIRRATADLRRLQTERLFRTAMLPENADASTFGLASFQEVLPKLQNEAKAQLLAVLEPVDAALVLPAPRAEATNQTETAPETADPAPAHPAPATEPLDFKHYLRTEAAEILEIGRLNGETN
jgi:hypothetical protein